MKLKLFFLVTLQISALSLTSCSGLNKVCIGPSCTNNNNATVSVNLTGTPLTPPPSTSILAFTVNVAGISLTSASGSAENINLNSGSTTYAVDLTKLQSDSVFLGGNNAIPTPASFTSVSVSFTAPTLTYCTVALSGIGCAPGSIKQLSGAPATPAISTTLNLSAKQQVGLAINVDLSKVITFQGQTPSSVSLTNANAVTLKTLPPAASSLPATALDFVEDVTGVVTAVNSSSQSVTVKTATRGSITAIANFSTIFSPNCTALLLNPVFGSCIQMGQVASLDTLLNPDGTFTLLEYDPLNATTSDWIEGIVTVTPTSSTQFQIVANDLVLQTSNSLIGSILPLGTTVTVNFSGSSPFLVDSKGFNVQGASSFGGTDTSKLLPGQTVAVRIKNFTPPSGTPPVAVATVDFLYLRFTRVAGTVSSTGGANSFAITSLPPFFGLVTPVTVQLSSGSPSTNFDGVTSGSDSNFASGTIVSIRAIYLNPLSNNMPFTAAKVRVP